MIENSPAAQHLEATSLQIYCPYDNDLGRHRQVVQQQLGLVKKLLLWHFHDRFCFVLM